MSRVLGVDEYAEVKVRKDCCLGQRWSDLGSNNSTDLDEGQNLISDGKEIVPSA